MSLNLNSRMRIVAVMPVLLLVAPAGDAQADVMNMSAGLTSLEFVPIGNAGNPGDSRIVDDSSYGSVAYPYSMGKYEITSAQYVEFLNAVAATDTYGLYNADWSPHPNGYYGNGILRSGAAGSYSYTVASDWANRPVNWVTLWDARRFVNWLHNGQPSGAQDATTTEDGAYTLNGYIGSNGSSIVRNPSARFAIPSADEWHKAAYYDVDKPGGAGYWTYPARSDTEPVNTVLPVDGGNNANYFADPPHTYAIGYPYYKTEVGEFENSASAYGTFDQGGNVFEWTEALAGPSGPNYYYFLKGGDWQVNGTPLGYSGYMNALSPGRIGIPSYESEFHGFRVAAVPEPNAFVLGIFGTMLACAWRLRTTIRDKLRCGRE